jgi:hypothetical protein
VVVLWRILVGVVGYWASSRFRQKKRQKKDDRPKKETTDEQIDMQSWDGKRQKIKNLQMANLLSMKPKKMTDEQTDSQQICKCWDTLMNSACVHFSGKSVLPVAFCSSHMKL